MKGNVLSVERVVPASPQAIFALLSDASRHREIDGSGTLVGVEPGAPEHLSLGSTFGMSMKMGIGYSMVNSVVEFEQDRRIAWKATPAGALAGRLGGGRIWRYELEPTDGGTLVRESWDLSRDKQGMVLKRVLAGRTRQSMEKTLERIEEITRGS